MNQSTIYKSVLCQIAVVSAAALLTACGSGSDATASGADTEAGSPANTPLRAIVQVTVKHEPRGQSAYAIICEGGVTQLQGVTSINADQACAALADPAVQDRLINGQAADRACDTVEGGDATATGNGSINDATFEFTLTRKDSCDISDWDGLLSSVLAAANR